MSDGMVFVLHGLADEKYAADLAAQLGGLTLAHGAAPVQFGANVLCIQVWSGATSAASLPDNTVICRLGAAPLPFGRHVFDAAGDAEADAAALRPLITTLQTQLEERSTRSRGAAPRLGSTPLVVERRKPPLAARSAAGMVVTLGVAGVMAPMIMERAQATSTTSTPPAAQAQTVTAQTAPATPVAANEPASSTPAVDQWLTEEPAHMAPPHRARALPISLTEAPLLATPDGVDAAPMSRLDADMSLAALIEPIAPSFGHARGKVALSDAGEPSVKDGEDGADNAKTVLP